MPRYAAFLRGVMPTNCKMSELKKAFESAGFTEVTTFLASGNVAFDAPKASNAVLEKKVEAAIEKGLGPGGTTCGQKSLALHGGFEPRLGCPTECTPARVGMRQGGDIVFGCRHMRLAQDVGIHAPTARCYNGANPTLERGSIVYRACFHERLETVRKAEGPDWKSGRQPRQQPI